MGSGEPVASSVVMSRGEYRGQVEATRDDELFLCSDSTMARIPNDQGNNDQNAPLRHRFGHWNVG